MAVGGAPFRGKWSDIGVRGAPFRREWDGLEVGDALSRRERHKYRRCPCLIRLRVATALKNMRFILATHALARGESCTLRLEVRR